MHLANSEEGSAPDAAPLFACCHFEREDIQLPMWHIPEVRMRARFLIESELASSRLEASSFERQPVFVSR